MDLRAVIVGGGRVGLHAAKRLDEHGHAVVLVERDPDRCAELAEEYVASVIEGDGTHPEVFAQTDPGRVDVVAGLTGDAGTNLAVCLLAERLADEVRTVMRVGSQADVGAYDELVDAAVFPERAGGATAASFIAAAELRQFEQFGGELELSELEVGEDAPIAGRQLSDVSLPAGSLVITDADADELATAETTFEAGDVYLVALEPGVAEEVRQLFQG